jgi:hypothetical protein
VSPEEDDDGFDADDDADVGETKSGALFRWLLDDDDDDDGKNVDRMWPQTEA